MENATAKTPNETDMLESRIAALEENVRNLNAFNQSVTTALTHMLTRLKDLEPIAGWATLSGKKFEDFRSAYTLSRASMMFPKGRSVVFVGKGYFGDNVKYAFLAFNEYAKGKDIKVSYVTDDPKQYDLLTANGLPCLPCEPDKWSIDNINALLGAKVAVLNDNFHPYAMKTPKAFGMLQGAKTIQLWHGIPIKNVGLRYLLRADNVLLEELIASSGPYDVFIAPDGKAQAEWSQMFAYKEFAPLGYPRNDVLFREPTSLDRLNTDAETLALFEAAKKSGKPVMLYTPTFRDDAASGWFEKAGITDLAEHCRHREYVFAVNLHPFEQGNIEKFRQGYPGIHFIKPGTDLYPLLRYTTALITDYSSLMFDYLLLDRPIVFYRPDHENYMTKQRGFIPGREKITPGAVTTTINELIRATDAAVNFARAPATDPSRIARHDLRAKSFDFADGNASQRVCERIEAMLDAD